MEEESLAIPLRKILSRELENKQPASRIYMRIRKDVDKSSTGRGGRINGYDIGLTRFSNDIPVSHLTNCCDLWIVTNKLYNWEL